jgi:glycerol-3-phosphate dehydrogenase (NAD(P)+)
VARTTVFGAGAMGTAVAMHLARNGHPTILWASPYDEKVLPDLLAERRHPALPQHLPESLRVLGPDALADAVAECEVAVMGASSSGARTLVRLVLDGCDGLELVVGIAKGLEKPSGRRMSEVYAAEVGHDRVVSVGGPALAPDVALGLHTAAVFASARRATAEEAASIFRSATFHVSVTDDLAGLEYCTVAKNVAAIGMGVLDGMGRIAGQELRNAKAALFTRAFGELARLIPALGGREETAAGLAGLGDMLVTSLGGRNRLYGELLGEGVSPNEALAQLEGKGMTVEGVESTADVARLAEECGLRLPFFAAMHRIIFEGHPAASVLDCLQEDLDVGA